MERRCRWVAPWAAVLLLCGAGFEDQMSQAEFEQAGLDKLSAVELAYLNAYLGRTVRPPEPTAVTSAPAQESDSSKRQAPRRAVRPNEPIKSRIRGEFRGWEGRTRFVLENGQVWQQRVAGTYGHRAFNPPVTIAKGRFGHYLILDASGRRVGVKRLR